METRHQHINEWVHGATRGSLRLPSFQREESWDKNRVRKSLNTLLYKSRPVGVLLVLENKLEKGIFATKPVDGFPEFDKNSEKCTSYLLGGQQWMTALLRSTHDNHDTDTFYVRFVEESSGRFDLAPINPGVDLDDGDAGVAVYPKTASFYGNPGEEYKRGLLPVRLLGAECGSDLFEWIRETPAHDNLNLKAFVFRIKEDFNGKYIPYFSLPTNTDASEAIDVFLEMNASSPPPSRFDIAVAQFETKTRKKLPDFIERLREEVPEIDPIEGETTRGGGVGNMALSGACLLQDISPAPANFMKLALPRLEKDWDAFCVGVKGAVDLLAELKIYNEAVLPTDIPLRVLPALWPEIPTRGDARADAMRIVRAYLWRAFCTHRYSRQANNRLRDDFQRMKTLFKERRFPPADEVFTVKDDFAVPSADDLLNHDKDASGIVTRGILLASLQSGGRDIADGDEYSRSNCDSRQKHRIFPKALLAAKAKGKDPDLALNLMWTSGFTDKTVGARYPGDYLLDRVKNSGHRAPDGEVLRRLESHSIPADMLMRCVKDSNRPLGEMYKEFIHARAKLIAAKIQSLCDSAE